MNYVSPVRGTCGHSLFIGQRHCVPDSIRFRRHKQNSGNCVVTCGAIPLIKMCHDCSKDIFHERISPTDKMERPTKRCVVCYKHNKRKETVLWCPDCEAALCVEGSLKTFRTKLNF